MTEAERRKILHMVKFLAGVFKQAQDYLDEFSQEIRELGVEKPKQEE